MINLRPLRTQVEDIQPGETQRFNHDNCSAGIDTRRRLYITRQMADPTRVVAYCHNCQQSGGLNGHKYESYRDHKHRVGSVINPVVVTNDIKLPRGLMTTLDDWALDAYAWAIKNKLSQEDIDKYYIGLDPSTGRVILPSYDHIIKESGRKGSLLGYQARKVDDSEGPKYYTVRKSDEDGYSLLFTHDSGVDLSVIVEDLVSGIHIARALQGTKAKIVVNYGTKINLQALEAMGAQGNNTRYVWLDNDSDHVKGQAKIMGRTLDLLYSGSTIVIGTHSDPKHYSEAHIRDALGG